MEECRVGGSRVDSVLFSVFYSDKELSNSVVQYHKQASAVGSPAID